MKKDLWYENTTSIDTPKWVLFLINNFWITRENFSIKIIDKYITKKINNSFLDIWCWDGRLCNDVIWKFKKIYWLDINIKRVQKCNKNDKNIKYLEHDMNNKLEFDDNKFDFITSLVVFDWIYDLNKALNETNRVLKKWWIFILEVNNLWFLLRRFKLLFWKYPKISAFSNSEWKKIWRDSSVSHVFTKKELQNYLETFWFEVLEVSWTWFAYQLRNWRPSLLCWDLFYILKKK